jgi:hypothetical protein
MGKIIYSTDNEISFFSTWSEEMAYVLGLLFADGSIKKTRGVFRGVTILLKRNDEQVLHNIKALMNSERPVLIVRNGYAVEFGISNTNLTNKLIELGMKSRKTYDCDFPYIPQEYVSHFARGYFDGDGHVSIRVPTGRVRETVSARVVGTRSFLTGLLSEFQNQTGNQHGSVQRHGANCYCLSLCGIDSASAFFDWIYKDSTDLTRMLRKYEKYEKFMKEWRHLISNKSRCRRSDCKIPQ